MAETALPHLEFLEYHGQTASKLTQPTAPKLHHCVLVDPAIGWHASSITHLDLAEGWRKGHPSFGELLDLLKASKQLQWLCVHGCVRKPLKKYEGGIAILPNLKYISLADTPEQCVAFLQHISLSPHARTVLSLRNSTKEDVSAALNLLASKLHPCGAKGATQITGISFKMGEHGPLDIRLFIQAHRNYIGKDHDVEAFRKGYKLEHQLTLNWTAMNTVSFISVGAALIGLCVTNNVDKLALEVPGHYSEDVCAEAFTLFPNMCSLHLSSSNNLDNLHISTLGSDLTDLTAPDGA
ncbi:hypothetical protein OF83DRAFT_1173929 [Amylostereum chailletii]|nr:hypothetical protein OF83DRAFT_1173929 [Amylostereum chailletii]